MKKYKVLIAHNYYQIPGGEDTVVLNEKLMLEENGHEVILYKRHNDEIKSKGLIGKMKLFFTSLFSLKTYREVRNIIDREKVEVVHVHNTLPLLSPSVYYAAFSKKIPVVQTIHNFRLVCPGATFTRNNEVCEACLTKGLGSSLKYRCYRDSFTQTFVVYLTMKIHRLLGTYKRVNAYIALTEFNKGKILTLVGREERIFVKPNFVKQTQASLEGRNIEDYFVFIGRLDKLKGIGLLIEAWKDVRDSKLLVIGDGPERENVEKIISENKLPNVQLLGFMDRNKAFEIIKKSKAVIVPSQWYEGFPMTIAESFGLGVPVAAGNIGNLPCIIEDGKNGILFQYNDKSDISNKINMLKKDIEFIKKLGEGAYDSFVTKYSDKINYHLLYSIYNKIAGE